MPKTIVSGGDSFTWGNDLPDCNQGHASRLSWAAFAAQELGYNYRCLAKPGAGNSAIVRRMLTGLPKLDHKDIMVAVMWTFPTRLEVAINRNSFTNNPSLFSDSDENFVTVSHWHANTMEESLSNIKEPDRISYFKKQFKEIKDSGLHDYAKSLIAIADVDHYIIETLKSILLLQFYLEANNIPYVFCSSTDQIAQAKRSNNNFVQVIANQINWGKWATEDGFYDWAKMTKQKMLTMEHPDERAHIDWAVKFIMPRMEVCQQ